MIRREHAGELVILTQTAHSWVSGQLAARWGNERFARPEPHAEVLLAIEQHDGGWAEWEERPRLLPDGRPMGFMEMPLADHLSIWRRSAERLAAQSHYASLLVSMHGVGLLSMRMERRGGRPEARETMGRFLAEQQQRQAALRAKLAALPSYAPTLGDAALDANLRLLQACDALSLMLCVPWPAQRRLAVPGSAGTRELSAVVARVERDDTLVVEPWPFAPARFTVCAECRRLPQTTFAGEEAFHAALAAAPLARLEFLVEPGAE